MRSEWVRCVAGSWHWGSTAYGWGCGEWAFTRELGKEAWGSAMGRTAEVLLGCALSGRVWRPCREPRVGLVHVVTTCAAHTRLHGQFGH